MLIRDSTNWCDNLRPKAGHATMPIAGRPFASREELKSVDIARCQEGIA